MLIAAKVVDNIIYMATSQALEDQLVEGYEGMWVHSEG